MKYPYARSNRRGSILVMTAALVITAFAILAFAIDLGYLQLSRVELQRAADSAAIAGAWELLDPEAVDGQSNPLYAAWKARLKADEFAGLNKVATESPDLAVDDVTVGYLADPLDPSCQMLLDSSNGFNAIRVRVRRTAEQNGEVPHFFARVLGFEQSGVEAAATAALITNFRGFRVSDSGEGLMLLPFALDRETWDALLAGQGADQWTWNEELGTLVAGPDGVLEVNLFPQGTGSPGNRGTVDIGSSNNSTADIARQIVSGISQADLAHHGGSLEFNADGELHLNGDTGISAGMKDELASIIGQPRIIPIFSRVVGPGNNADYTIVEFAGIRVLDVKLTGKMKDKRVIIQPANVVLRGGIPGTGQQTSHFVFSPVWLVR